MNVLIAEDSKMTRVVAKKLLDALNVQNVYEAEDGQAALTIFQTAPIDVVFSDWNMPNMSGLELLKAVREIDREVPFVMITTERSKDRVREAIEHEVSDYLTKPFTPATLRAKVMKWVPKGNLADWKPAAATR